MPDFAPPPRRPAPDRLRNDIRSQLTAAPVRRVRLRTLVVPVAAASLVGVTIFGVSALGGRRAVAPVQTASPYPATATATPTPRPSARSSAPVTPQPTTATIDVRSMTKAEVRADTLSCRARTAGATDLPRRGTVQVQLAQVQRRAGIDGPLEQPSRTLILHDDAGVWVCENGDNTSWMAGRLTTRTRTTAVPAIEVPNYSDVSADCGSDARVHAKDLFAVGDQVRAGRVRLVIGDRRGPWQSSTPVDGLVHFLVGLTGPDIESRTVSMQYQFLGSDGQRLTIQPYGQRGTPTTSTLSKSVETCADARARLPRPEPIIRPTSDDTGIKTCLTMAKDAASTTVPVTVQWTARLVVSSKSEWGAVLSDGHHRVGCSLFPTREISPFSADSPEITRPASSSP